MRISFNPRTVIRSIALPCLALTLTQCAPPDIPEAREFVVTTRADGLAYASGQDTPFTGRYVVLGDSGNIREEYHYVNGVLHGPRRLYFDNGQVKRTYDFHHGEIVREREWYRHGQLKSDEMMRRGIAYGLSTFYYEDGRIRETLTLGDKLQPHGSFVRFSPEGELVADAIFQQGDYVSGLLPEGMLQHWKKVEGLEVSSTN